MEDTSPEFSENSCSTAVEVTAAFTIKCIPLQSKSQICFEFCIAAIFAILSLYLKSAKRTCKNYQKSNCFHHSEFYYSRLNGFTIDSQNIDNGCLNKNKRDLAAKITIAPFVFNVFLPITAKNELYFS